MFSTLHLYLFSHLYRQFTSSHNFHNDFSELNTLPVGRRTGVQNVLLRSEQGETVGIQVYSFHCHQILPSQWQDTSEVFNSGGKPKTEIPNPKKNNSGGVQTE